MRAATIRRLLVFGVCALGVASLYVVPGVTRVPTQTAFEPVNDEPTSKPTSQSDRGGSAAGGRGSSPDRSTAEPTSVRTGSAGTVSAPPTATRSADSRPTNRPATAYEPVDRADAEAPERVTEVRSAKSSHERVDLSWSAAKDNVGVVAYTVSLNGYPMVTTAETHTSLRWFSDDSTQQVVQIQALDAAGNQSESVSVVLTRPEADPTETPTPEPSAPPPEPSPSETQALQDQSQHASPTPEPTTT